MPRRTLYQTPAEKLAANRLKSARHYAKNKECITHIKRLKYQLRTNVKATNDSDRAPDKEYENVQVDSLIDHYTLKSHKLYQRVVRTLGGRAISFLDRAFHIVTQPTSPDDRTHRLENLLAQITPLHRRSSRIVDKLSKLAGYSPQTSEAEALREYLDCILTGLADLELALMSEDGRLALIEMEAAGELSYQSPGCFSGLEH